MVFDHMIIKTLEENEIIENEFIQRKLEIQGNFHDYSKIC